MHNRANGRERETCLCSASQGEEYGRMEKAGQSSAGELVHRSSAIYASGRAEKYRQPARRAMRRKRFYIFRPDAQRAAPPRCSRLRRCPDRYSAPPHLASLHHRRRFALTHVFSFTLVPISFIFIAPALIPRALPVLARSARFRGYVTEWTRRGEFVPFDYFLIENYGTRDESRSREKRARLKCPATTLRFVDHISFITRVILPLEKRI